MQVPQHRARDCNCLVFFPKMNHIHHQGGILHSPNFRQWIRVAGVSQAGAPDADLESSRALADAG